MRTYFVEKLANYCERIALRTRQLGGIRYGEQYIDATIQSRDEAFPPIWIALG